jgi:hypothetical protein
MATDDVHIAFDKFISPPEGIDESCFFPNSAGNPIPLLLEGFRCRRLSLPVEDLHELAHVLYSFHALCPLQNWVATAWKLPEFLLPNQAFLE